MSQHGNKIKQSNIKKYIEVRENRGRRLNFSGVLFTEPQSLTVFFPEFFKTAQSPELKLMNFGTNRPAGPSPLSAVPKHGRRAPMDIFLLCRNKINLIRWHCSTFCQWATALLHISENKSEVGLRKGLLQLQEKVFSYNQSLCCNRSCPYWKCVLRHTSCCKLNQFLVEAHWDHISLFLTSTSLRKDIFLTNLKPVLQSSHHLQDYRDELFVTAPFPFLWSKPGPAIPTSQCAGELLKLQACL